MKVDIIASIEPEAWAVMWYRKLEGKYSSGSLIGPIDDPGNLMAIALCVALIIMPVFSRELRGSKSILIGYWFLITLRQVIAFTNGFLFPTPGADNDAFGLYMISEEVARNWEWTFSLGAYFYMHVLGAVFRVFGASHLLGEQLSIFAFALSCIVLLKVMRLIGFERYRVSSLIAFGALPTMIFLGSITTRESFQILFFMLSVYLGIKMHLKGGINGYAIGLVLSALIMGFLHKALIVYGLILIFMMLVWSYRPVTSLGNIKKIHLFMLIVSPIVLVGIVIVEQMNITGLSILSKLVNESWLEAIEAFRSGSIRDGGRTTYGINIDLSSNIASLYSIIKIYIYYLFAPFPWQIAGVSDLYAGLESAMRMILIFYSVRHWRNAFGPQRRLLGLMLLVYFSITFVWAIGTTNYGTGLRHHMLSWWIIVVAGVPPLMSQLVGSRLVGVSKQNSFRNARYNLS